MDTGHFLLDIGLALLLAAAFGWVARKLGFPAVVGYLVAGLVVSPFTPGYVADRHQIELLADVGVVLLLFEVGIEVDIGHVRREHGGLLWASPAQIGITTAVASLLLFAIGVEPYGAALVGLSVAMSSSVVVVNIIRSRRRTTDKPTEEGLLGWSVLQDVTGVALGTVIIATSGTDGRPLPVALALLGAYVVLAVIAAQALPIVLRHLRSEHDLFLIVSVASGLALAAAGAVWFGVPAALAAFVGGLAISNRAETAEARRRLLPFRDVFAVLFFVAVGTLIDPFALPAAIPLIGLLVALVVLAKVGLIWVLARIARLDARPVQLAVGLGQMGEFGYVLAGIGLAAGAVSDQMFTAVLATIVVTIAGSAVLVRFAGKPPPPAENAPPAAALRLGRPPSR